MVLKPSILRELAEENQLAPLPPPQDYNDASDDIILEDEIQRIKLVGNVNVGELVSGIIVAVLGEFKYFKKFQISIFKLFKLILLSQKIF